MKVLKETNHQRNQKEEGLDQGLEMREGEGVTDQETDTGGGDTPQVHPQAAQSQILLTDHINIGRRMRLIGWQS